VRDAQLLARLRDAVGPEHVLTDPALKAGYELDWTGRFRGRARAVVRPANASEVAAVVRACAELGAALVPQGGNTGLVGGGVPRGEPSEATKVGQVVVSLRRLTDLGPVDTLSNQVEAGAGVTLAALHEQGAAAGLAFGVDFAARDSATVGGMVATNAGGHHAMRYGSMRHQLVGLEAVLVDGSPLSRMSGSAKATDGYDIAGLLCGSEGTLAIVTAARLRLVPAATHRVSALVGLAGTEAALGLLAQLRRLPSLEAVEVMWADGIELVAAHAPAFPLTPIPPCVLTLECAGPADPTPELAELLAGHPTAVGDRRLWHWRERHSEAVASLGVPHKLDVSVPLDRLPALVDDVRAAISSQAPTATTIIWGHLAEGNLHVNVVGPPPDDEAVDQAVLRLVARYGGSISAEHGIGVAKARWLGLTRSPSELALMRSVKHAFDPAGLLNPGVLVPVDAD